MSGTVAVVDDQPTVPGESEGAPADRNGPPDRRADLVAAVDGLHAVATEPIHTHAARYQEVHTLLQAALSATDR